MGQSNNHTSERQTDQSATWGNASNGGPSHLERQYSGQSGDVLLHNAAKTKGDISAKALKEAQPADGDLRSEALLPEHDVHFSKIPGKGLPEDGILKAGVDVAKTQSIQLTEDKITVVDNFLDSEAEMKFGVAVATAKFKTVEYKGYKYEGVSPASDCLDSLVRKSLESSGVVSDMNDIEIKESFIRLETSETNLTCWIHADNVAGGTMAVVLYLSPHYIEGGTALWSHKIVGPSFNPVSKNAVAAEFIRRDTWDQSKWQLTDLIGYKYNRAAIYSANAFHSKYPLELAGTDRTDGRLVYVAFISQK